MPNTVHNYGSEPATIAAVHENGTIFEIFLHPEKLGEACIVTDGQIPRTAAAVRKLFPLDCVVVPPLSPLEEDEAYVTDETVRRNQGTRLASRNFRNIWLRATCKEFSEYKEIIELSWDEVKISKPEMNIVDRTVRMFFEEERIPKEVYWAGYGFQVWLQMIYQITRGTEDLILILDEPDIYLHPDLQRKLFHLVTKRFSQCFIRHSFN